MDTTEDYRGFELEVLESTNRPGQWMADGYRMADHKRVTTACAYHSGEAALRMLKHLIDTTA